MKQWLMVLVSLVLLSFIVVGCGDDETKDCPTCPTSQDEVTPKGFVVGSIYLAPETYIYDMWIFGYGAIPPNIDSMKVGDSLLYGEDYFDYSYIREYHDNFWTVDFDEDGTGYMYQHGDMATMMFYGNGMSSSCTVKILNADSAEVSISSPAYDDDTLTSTDSVTVTWDKSYDADYYSVFVEFCCGQNYDYIYKYYYTLDTTFMVTPDMAPDSLRYLYVNITPFTGPDPRTGESNITGDYLTGKVFSFGWYDYTRVRGVYPPPVPGKAVAGSGIEEPPHARMSPAQVIENLYKQYE
jgi:hypothetical protein